MFKSVDKNIQISLFNNLDDLVLIYKKRGQETSKMLSELEELEKRLNRLEVQMA